NGDGSFSYTPAADYNGADSFTYTVSDGHGGSASATVSLTVSAVNDAPVAADDRYGTSSEARRVGSAPGLLGNDSEAEGEPRARGGFSDPTHGPLPPSPDGSFTYTPAADYHGPDAFGYTVSDGHGGSARATVSLTVTAVNDAPVAADDRYGT